MTKKIFVALMAATLLLTGCGDSAESNEALKSAQASPVSKNIPIFTAKTIDGEVVTNDIFAKKKITMVNIWGTFCPPCIAEMPELGNMVRSLPEDAQIVGLICDASENSPQQIQKAREITRQANANFVNIVPDAQLIKFIENVAAVPTTIFVNSKGEVVGKAVIGADIKGYKHELEKLLK